MVSLTPCLASKVDRQPDLHEIAELHDAEDMIQQLNAILSKPHGFPQIPAPRKDCYTMTFKGKSRHSQSVMRLEQDCGNLVYMSDQNKSMIETLGIHEDPFWQERVEKFYGWFHKPTKTSKAAWTREAGQNTSKWSATRGSSKRHQFVPVSPADHPNPEERSLPWRDTGDLNASYDYLYPDNPVEERPVPKIDHLETEQQQPYMRWIERIFHMDRRTTKDPRLYCAYCDMNNHPRFSRKHVFKHQAPHARHRCTLCAGHYPPFLCSKAQVNDGGAKPTWYKIEYKRARQDGREPDYRWGENITHVDVDPPQQASQYPVEDSQPQCAAAAMMHGLSIAAPVSIHGSSELQFEATGCRLWSNGILDQIMVAQEGVHSWIAGMTDELVRLHHGSSRCSRPVLHLYRSPPWQHLPSSSNSPRHPLHLLLFQSSQPRCQEIPLWHPHRGMHHFQEEWEPIHGMRHGNRSTSRT